MRRIIGVSVVVLPALLATWFFARGFGDLIALIAFPSRTSEVAPMVPTRPETPARALVVAKRSSEPVAVGPCAIASRVVALVADEENPAASRCSRGRARRVPQADGARGEHRRRTSRRGDHRAASVARGRTAHVLPRRHHGTTTNGARRCRVPGNRAPRRHARSRRSRCAHAS